MSVENLYECQPCKRSGNCLDVAAWLIVFCLLTAWQQSELELLVIVGWLVSAIMLMKHLYHLIFSNGMGIEMEVHND